MPRVDAVAGSICHVSMTWQAASATCGWRGVHHLPRVDDVAGIICHVSMTCGQHLPRVDDVAGIICHVSMTWRAPNTWQALCDGGQVGGAGRRPGVVCTGTLVHYEQTVRAGGAVAAAAVAAAVGGCEQCSIQCMIDSHFVHTVAEGFKCLVSRLF